ncbi:hypothetical protein EVB32_165 [Rhizobium phage RHph_TM39]|uniref:Uncharacterized protein n=2 Tax=Cuauhnahuacvirus TaxID=3044696 RepID=A0A7S5R7V7_9CAUD|nr:hypothetical protein PQC16_gp165 [Rhizobium phage RHph_TM30]YP_010671313.1 hypothetical protein PQC17_gp164 [Rhizobium phage RHph_Y65]QIG71634.1 hypothetical protein EVB94_163 [Rhizobium phage RHph_TM40]QIG71998.1 hypothetical protein EVB95_164 [Rhizobium phage RHph_TM2_3B]QIG72361.1 hypothetical protein EVB96_165 [Rhizobium phage RHph_TM3_3_6]QIG77153.1 hypothetical protein EVB32_165 [Rhizobium phage RHph_TM39]QIG77487.1 hypothetical protein EVB61_159 [Rhizobium phage RHph_TM21B]QIG77749
MAIKLDARMGEYTGRQGISYLFKDEKGYPHRLAAAEIKDIDLSDLVPGHKVWLENWKHHGGITQWYATPRHI